MTDLFKLILGVLASLFRSRAKLEAEILVLRQQIILAQAMQSMAIRGFIVHNRESGAYALTDSGRATLAMILENAGLAPK